MTSYYTITGMSCAACTARVEKAVSRVEGVTSCSVNLLTNSMSVEGTASDHQIISAVQNAGYGAVLKKSDNNQNFKSSSEEEIKSGEVKQDIEGQGNTCSKKTFDCFSGISDGSYVFFYGAYHVGVAGAGFL